MQTVVIHDESLGKDFTVVVCSTAIVMALTNLAEANEDPDGGDYPVVGSNDRYCGDTITQESRDSDIKRINELIAIFKEPELTEKFVKEHVHPSQPTKKNGSYAKNRVSNHAYFPSFGVYWEDHYGDNTPAIRCRSKNDYEAVLLYEEYIVKY